MVFSVVQGAVLLMSGLLTRCLSLCVVIGLMGFGCAAYALDIHVQGLFRDAAVLVINGNQQMLKAGKRSPEGVLLISADRQQALIEYQGERHTLSLTRQITTQYNEVKSKEVAIRRNELNQYIATAKINDKRIRVLVDTGANAVAMSSRDARRLGIDYQSGMPTRVKTASGITAAYTVKLRVVEVGGIKANHIDGFVIEGGFPEQVLLGMSYLEHVDLREESGILYLKGKY